MVIFEVARSCALPAARGLRPQAPAVLPRLCQQGAGGRGSRHPAEHTRPTGTAGSVGHAALPEETKASVAAGGGESPDASVSASLPGRAPTLGLQQGVLPGRRKPGPASGPGKQPRRDKTVFYAGRPGFQHPRGLKRRGLEPVRPKANKPASKRRTLISRPGPPSRARKEDREKARSRAASPAACGLP